MAVSTRAAAARIGISVRILKKAKSADCPAFRERGSVDVKALKKWLAEHPEIEESDRIEEAIQQAKAEREFHRARILRVKTGLMTGELVKIDDMRVAITRMVTNLKFKILAQPKKLAQRIAIESDPAAIEQLLEKEAKDILASVHFPYGFTPCPECGKKVI